MRKPVQLRFMQIDRSEIVREPDGWRMRARLTGWRGWLARLLWRALGRLRALEPFMYTETIYEYREPELTELFYQQIGEIADRGGDPRDYCLVIGGEEFSHIVKGYRDLSSRGLVVPWAISGINVLEAIARTTLVCRFTWSAGSRASPSSQRSLWRKKSSSARWFLPKKLRGCHLKPTMVS